VSCTVASGLRATAFPIFDLQGHQILSATAIASDAISARDDARAHVELGPVCAAIFGASRRPCATGRRIIGLLSAPLLFD
jgi:hypothetical protein